MKLSEEQMEYLEQMTMLRVLEEHREEILENVGKIVKYIEILKFTEEDDIEEEDVSVCEIQLRNDEVRAEYTKENIITNAPQEKDGMFVVPKTISEQGAK